MYKSDSMLGGGARPGLNSYGLRALKRRRQERNQSSTESNADKESAADPDSRTELLIGGTSDGTILVWDIGNIAETVCQIQAHNTSVIDIKCCHANALVVSFATDMSIKIWDGHSMSLKFSLQGQISPTCTALSQRGGYLLCGYKDGTSEIVSTATGKFLILDSDYEHSDIITSADFLDDMGLFLTCSLDGFVKVWSLNKDIVKVIATAQSLKAACFLNENGDILVGEGDHISVVKAATYLPPCYLNGKKKLMPDEWKGILEPSTGLQQQSPKTRDGTVLTSVQEIVGKVEQDPESKFDARSKVEACSPSSSHKKLHLHTVELTSSSPSRPPLPSSSTSILSPNDHAVPSARRADSVKDCVVRSAASVEGPSMANVGEGRNTSEKLGSDLSTESPTAKNAHSRKVEGYNLLPPLYAAASSAICLALCYRNPTLPIISFTMFIVHLLWREDFICNTIFSSQIIWHQSTVGSTP
jgi:hypothetical protein